MAKEKRSITPFTRKVLASIRRIPRGRVATYGQIAILAGSPQGSRGVSWILHSSSATEKLPWHRVINSQGKISFPRGSSLFIKQRRLLRTEGVEVGPAGEVDRGRFQWKTKKPARLRASGPRMFSKDS